MPNIIHSGSCSCNSCVYKSRSKLPSVQQLIETGSRVDRLYYGKYLPLRERKLLEKLIRTRAVYDDVRIQLLSASDNEDDSTERSSAVTKIVDLVDRGQIGSTHSTKLGSCCSCCSCSSLKKIRDQMDKHPYVHKHNIPDDAIARYTIEARKRGRARRKRLSTKVSAKVRAVHFKAKRIRSAPCNCTFQFSDKFKRISKGLLERSESREVGTVSSEPSSHDVKGKSKGLKLVKCLCNLKHSKRPNRATPKVKRTRTTSSGESDGLTEQRFRSRKDSLSIIRERLKRKKEMKNWECEDDVCIPGECRPRKCYYTRKSHGSGKRKMKKYPSKFSGTDITKSTISISTRKRVSNANVGKKQKKSHIKCMCPEKVTPRMAMNDTRKLNVKLKPHKNINFRIQPEKKTIKKNTMKNAKQQQIEAPSSTTCECPPAIEEKIKQEPEVEMSEEAQHTEEIELQPKQAVRIGSKFSFNIEFHKETTSPDMQILNNLNKNTEDLYEASHNNLKSKSHKVKRNHRTKTISSQSTLPVRVAHRNHGLKRCFCTLKIPKRKQNPYKSASRKTMTTLYVRNVDVVGRVRETQTKPFKIQPSVVYVQPPLTSKTRRISHRHSKRANTLRTPKRSASIMSRETSSKKMQANAPAYRQKKRDYKPDVEKPGLSVRGPHRRSLRISSSFSFNIEFSKENICYEPPSEEIEKKPIASKHEKKHFRHQGIKVYKPRVRQTTSQTIKTDKTKQTHTKRKVDQCICPSNILKEKRTGTPIEYRPSSGVVMKHQMVAADNMIEKYYRHQGTPCECKPGICIPPDCDPHECDKRIRIRKAMNRNRYANISEHKLEKSTTSKSLTSTKHRQGKNKHTRKDKHDTSVTKCLSGKKVVRIGSSFSFDIEFYKEQLPCCEEKTPEFTHNKPTTDVTRRLGHKTDILGHKINLEEKGLQAHRQNTNHMASGTEIFTGNKNKISVKSTVNRCLCKLNKKDEHKRGTTNAIDKRKRNRNVRQELSVANASEYNPEIERSTETIVLKPKYCRPDFCNPEECCPPSRARHMHQNMRCYDAKRYQQKPIISIHTTPHSENTQSYEERHLRSCNERLRHDRITPNVLQPQLCCSRQDVRIGSTFDFSIDFSKQGRCHEKKEHPVPKPKVIPEKKVKTVKPKKVKVDKPKKVKVPKPKKVKIEKPKKVKKTCEIGPKIKGAFGRFKKRMNDIQEKIKKIKLIRSRSRYAMVKVRLPSKHHHPAPAPVTAAFFEVFRDSDYRTMDNNLYNSANNSEIIKGIERTHHTTNYNLKQKTHDEESKILTKNLLNENYFFDRHSSKLSGNQMTILSTKHANYDNNIREIYKNYIQASKHPFRQSLFALNVQIPKPKTKKIKGRQTLCIGSDLSFKLEFYKQEKPVHKKASTKMNSTIKKQRKEYQIGDNQHKKKRVDQEEDKIEYVKKGAAKENNKKASKKAVQKESKCVGLVLNRCYCTLKLKSRGKISHEFNRNKKVSKQKNPDKLIEKAHKNHNLIDKDNHKGNSKKSKLSQFGSSDCDTKVCDNNDCRKAMISKLINKNKVKNIESQKKYRPGTKKSKHGKFKFCKCSSIDCDTNVCNYDVCKKSVLNNGKTGMANKVKNIEQHTNDSSKRKEGKKVKGKREEEKNNKNGTKKEEKTRTKEIDERKDKSKMNSKQNKRSKTNNKPEVGKNRLHRQAVRFGSDISFNLEFYRDSPKVKHSKTANHRKGKTKADKTKGRINSCFLCQSYSNLKHNKNGAGDSKKRKDKGHEKSKGHKEVCKNCPKQETEKATSTFCSLFKLKKKAPDGTGKNNNDAKGQKKTKNLDTTKDANTLKESFICTCLTIFKLKKKADADIGPDKTGKNGALKDSNGPKTPFPCFYCNDRKAAFDSVKAQQAEKARKKSKDQDKAKYHKKGFSIPCSECKHEEFYSGTGKTAVRAKQKSKDHNEPKNKGKNNSDKNDCSILSKCGVNKKKKEKRDKPDEHKKLKHLDELTDICPIFCDCTPRYCQRCSRLNLIKKGAGDSGKNKKDSNSKPGGNRKDKLEIVKGKNKNNIEVCIPRELEETLLNGKYDKREGFPKFWKCFSTFKLTKKGAEDIKVKSGGFKISTVPNLDSRYPNLYPFYKQSETNDYYNKSKTKKVHKEKKYMTVKSDIAKETKTPKKVKRLTRSNEVICFHKRELPETALATETNAQRKKIKPSLVEYFCTLANHQNENEIDKSKSHKIVRSKSRPPTSNSEQKSSEYGCDDVETIMCSRTQGKRKISLDSVKNRFHNSAPCTGLLKQIKDVSDAKYSQVLRSEPKITMKEKIKSKKKKKYLKDVGVYGEQNGVCKMIKNNQLAENKGHQKQSKKAIAVKEKKLKKGNSRRTSTEHNGALETHEQNCTCCYCTNEAQKKGQQSQKPNVKTPKQPNTNLDIFLGLYPCCCSDKEVNIKKSSANSNNLPDYTNLNPTCDYCRGTSSRENPYLLEKKFNKNTAIPASKSNSVVNRENMFVITTDKALKKMKGSGDYMKLETKPCFEMFIDKSDNSVMNTDEIWSRIKSGTKANKKLSLKTLKDKKFIKAQSETAKRGSYPNIDIYIDKSDASVMNSDEIWTKLKADTKAHKIRNCKSLKNKKFNETQYQDSDPRMTPCFKMYIDKSDASVLNSDEIWTILKPNHTNTKIHKKIKSKSLKDEILSKAPPKREKSGKTPCFDMYINKSDLSVLNANEIRSKLKNDLTTTTRKKIKSKCFKDDISIKTVYEAEKSKGPACLLQIHGKNCSCCYSKGRKNLHIDEVANSFQNDKPSYSKQTYRGLEYPPTFGKSDKNVPSQSNTESAKSKTIKKDPCICGSQKCQKQVKKERETLLEALRRAKLKPCPCGAKMCAAETKKASAMLSRKQRRTLKKVDKAEKAKRGKKTPTKRKCWIFGRVETEQEKREKLRLRKQKQSMIEKKIRKAKYMKEDAKRRRLRIANDKKAWKHVKKYKNRPDCVLCAESFLDVGKLVCSVLTSIFRTGYRTVRDPKASLTTLRERASDPEHALRTIKETIAGTGIIGTATRVRGRISAMSCTSKLVSKMESNPATNFMVHLGNPKKRLKSIPKKRVRIPLDFQCSLFMGSLRKKPHLWVYYMCPWFYPHCISLVGVWRQFTDLLMFLLAVAVWSPCIFAMEACRALICCFLCTG